MPTLVLLGRLLIAVPCACPRRAACLAVAALLVWIAPSSTASAFTPESPEVKDAVARAVGFLENAKPDQRLGAQVLVARVLVHQGKPDHPRVQAAVEAIRKRLKEPAVEETTLIYSLGLSLAFLAELDAVKYRSDIDAVIRALLERQKNHGGWGYENRPTGDTSMTQYAVYGLWSAAQHGIVVDEKPWNNAAQWLLRVQDVGGGWPYQGTDPGTYEKVKQDDVRRSMTEAAMASLYLCGNRFGIWNFRTTAEPKVSPLLHPVAPEEAEAKPTLQLDRKLLNDALAAGQHWLATSSASYNAEYPLYHLYTIERLQTFRTAALGATARSASAAAPWYDEGVRYLLPKQAADGSWNGAEGSTAGTAFGVLFLIRSTRVALTKVDALGPGTLVGGRGIPQNIGARPASRPGAPVAGAQDKLDALLQQLNDPQFLESLSGLENLQPVKDQPAPSALMKRLGELARGDSPESKAAALRALGRGHDIRQAPLLIEAIGDPNPVVYQAAVDGLRYLSRDSDNYGKPVPPDEATRSAEAKRWMQWYRTIRPTGP